MSGSKSGVAVQIKSEEERALYIYIYIIYIIYIIYNIYIIYIINLAVGDTMKVCPILKDTIDNISELRKLVCLFV